MFSQGSSSSQASEQEPDYVIVAQKVDIEIPALLGVFDSSVKLKKGSRLATVDPAWNGTGDPKVTFDGEDELTQKGYKYLHKPAPGARVVMDPIGPSWIITGPIDGSVGFVQGIYPWTVPLTLPSPPYANTPQTLATMSLPDPGWPYKICCFAQTIWKAHGTFGIAPYHLAVLLDSTGGTEVSRIATEIISTGLHYCAFPTFHYTTLEGAHTLYFMLVPDGSGILDSLTGGAFGGLAVFQVPA